MDGAKQMVEKIDEAPVQEINHLNTPPKIEEAHNLSQGDSKDVNTCPENQMPPLEEEEEIIKKKYGGLLPKKPPLISKDNERAFFDSADWALGKVGAQKSKGPLEALRPKLQPTPHQHTRSRSASGLSNDGEDGCNFDDFNAGENRDSALDSRFESHNDSSEYENLQN